MVLAHLGCDIQQVLDTEKPCRKSRGACDPGSATSARGAGSSTAMQTQAPQDGILPNPFFKHCPAVKLLHQHMGQNQHLLTDGIAPPFIRANLLKMYVSSTIKTT